MWANWLPQLQQYSPMLFTGLLNTLLLWILVAIPAHMAGMGLAVLRIKTGYGIPQSLAILTYGIRAVPVIMMLALLHYAVLPSIGYQSSFWFSAWLGLFLYHAACYSEIYRGGFYSIHPEEVDTARSLGLSWQQRYGQVLLPLVWHRCRATRVNQDITLLKDTALGSIIGVIELTRSAELIYEQTLMPVLWLTVVALLYFGVCYWHARQAEQHALAV